MLSVSHGLVYINIPGRTCLHELFIGYEQVTAWVARFSFKLETNYHQPLFALDGSMGRRTSRRYYSWLTSYRQLEGTIGRVADTAHTGSFITRRSHLNLLWIHIVLSTPMIYKLCRFISRLNMENLKPTPRVILRLGGYSDLTREPRVVGGNDNPVSEAATILMKL